LLAVLVLCIAYGLVLESRFTARFSGEQPLQWKELASRSRWLHPEDGNCSYAGVQWYVLLLGEYKQLEDQSLRLLASRTRRVMIASLILGAAVVGLSLLANAGPSHRCLLALVE
jgi:hypothetical protein